MTSGTPHQVIKSSKMRSARHAIRTRENRDNYMVMVAKSEGKWLIRMSRSGWDDNIK
jgi:hypothetical protein